MAAGAAALALIGAPTANADPTPTPSPDYTWECDIDVYGHTSCTAEPIPRCAITADGTWVVKLPTGTDFGPGQIPAPCYGPGGYQAPYPASVLGLAPVGPQPGDPGYSDGD